MPSIASCRLVRFVDLDIGASIAIKSETSESEIVQTQNTVNLSQGEQDSLTKFERFALLENLSTIVSIAAISQ